MPPKPQKAKGEPTGWRAWLAAVRRAVRDPVHQLDERARNIRRIIEAMRRAFRSLMRDDVPRMAAALTYRTIFSLIPTLVLAFIVMNAFAGEDTFVEQQLTQILDYLNLRELQVRTEDAAEVVEMPLPTNEGFGPDGTEEFTEQGYSFRLNIGPDELRDTPDDSITAVHGEDMVSLTPGPDGRFGTRDDVKQEWLIAAESARTVSEWIQRLVDRVQAVSLGAIGSVGLLILVYAAIGLMVEVEQCFNQIYSAPRGRFWVKKVPQYWLVLTLGPALLIAGFWVGEQFRTWVADLAGAEILGGEGTGDGETGSSAEWLVRIAGYLVTIFISWALLLLLYQFVPNTKVQLRSALVGSFLAAVTWEIGKALFREYLQGRALTTLYGSLALLPLFLLWVYVTWILVLFGLKVSYLLQHAEWRPHEVESARRQAIVAPSIIVATALRVAKAFKEGKTVDAGELSAAVSLEAPVLEQVLTALEERNVLRRAEPGEAGRSGRPDAADNEWTLARPADQIPAADLVRIGQSVARLDRVVAARVGAAAGEGERRDAESRVDTLARIEEAQVRAVENVTLADLLRESESAADGNSTDASGRIIATDGNGSAGAEDGETASEASTKPEKRGRA